MVSLAFGAVYPVYIDNGEESRARLYTATGCCTVLSAYSAPVGVTAFLIPHF
jgi:hypothetical protein